MVKIPNSNLLLGVGGIIAAVFLVSQIRKAGADVVGALPVVDEGLRQSLTDIAGSVSSVTGQVADLTGGLVQFQKDAAVNLSQFQADSNQNLKSITDFFSNLFNQNKQRLDALELSQPGEGLPNPADDPTNPTQIDIDLAAGKDIIPIGFDPNANPDKFNPPADDGRGFTGREEDRALFDAGLIDQFGRPIQRPTSEERSDFVFPYDGLEVELPTDQKFGFGGPSFIGGTIRENPVDTLSEVLDLFPELTASQAADFLNEFSGISPTDALRVDPDITNLVANIGEENIQVPNVSISDLDEAERRASCTTCELFGLNCQKCNNG